MAGVLAFGVSLAHAGFTISVKPIAVAKPAPAVSTATAPVNSSVQVTPVAMQNVSPLVQMKVGKGESLHVATKAFLSQYGWTPAWLAGEVVSGGPMTFDGKDHEEALTAFLRHYNLIGERFVAEKGYVIRRSSESGAK